MKRFVALAAIALFIIQLNYTVVFAFVPKVNHMSTDASPNNRHAEVLSIVLMENVTILEDCSSQLSLLIDIPSSPLAEMYRKSLGAPLEASVDEEMPIPESILLSADTEDGENITQIVIPAREEFYKSIEQQQQVSLGFVTEIFDSKMVPRSKSNGCQISVNAFTSLPIVDISPVDSHYECEIAIGPRDINAIGAVVGSVFTSIELIQLMLESLPDEQLYECFWNTRIELPANAQLLNGHEIAGLCWKVDFGGGTYMNAWVSLDGSSTIVLSEKTVVTEQKISATPKYLYEAFSCYKAFNIEYLTNQPPEYTEQAGEVTESGDTWFYTWTATWSDSASKSFTYGSLDALLTVSASITLSGYVGWDFDLFEGLTRFESWMQLETSVDVDFEATATESLSKTWIEDLFEWKTTFWGVYFGVPVWADLEITATGVLTVSAYGNLLVTAGASASGILKAGVTWTSEAGWLGILEVDTSAERYGPTIEAEAGVWVRPSVEFRIAFLFYGVAGPFIEFEPYATATVTCSYPPPHGEWEITANLKIVAGATFAGWLKDLLGLDDWSTTLYDEALESWSGSWGSSSISITETLNPSTSPPSGSVQVYGTATFNDGSPVSYTDVIVTVAGSSWTATTDGTGGYSQFISAPESTGSHTVHVDLATGSLTGSNSKTLTVVEESPSGSRYTLSRTTTCKDVQSSDPYDPIEETNVFRRNDEKAVTWVHLTDVYESGERFPLIKVKWEFYDPAGGLYAQNERTVPDPGEGYYWEWYKCWAWIWIAGHSAADMEGRWHTKVYIDEGSGYEFKAMEEFVIGYEVTDRTMAKDVQTSEPYEPITRTNSFVNTDPKAWGWIRLDEVAETLEIKWEWFEPSGAKYAEFYWTTENPTEYWDWYKAWCWIAIYSNSPQSKLGTWEVRAYIQDVYGNWDLEYSQYFTISDNTPPGTPGTPVDDGDYSTTGTVTWTWTAAPEDGTIAKYQIQVGTTPGGNDVFDGYVGDLSKTLNSLPSGFTYYARVRAMNTVGQWGPWSGISDGIAVDRAPATIIVDGPSGTIDYNNVVFSWKGSDDITLTSSLVYSYRLEGYDADWSLWSPSTSMQYEDLEDGDYVFEVMAKDQIGNIDPTPANRSFTITALCTVKFYTMPSSSDFGITYQGRSYHDGETDVFECGTSGPAYASCLDDWCWEFYFWDPTGGVNVDPVWDPSTTVTILGDGTLCAIFEGRLFDIFLNSSEVDGSTSYLGTIIFDGEPCPLWEIHRTCGIYSVEYIPAPGYVFDYWEAWGCVGLINDSTVIVEPVNPPDIPPYATGGLTAYYRESEDYFDLGTPSSPVASGYVGVNETSLYDSGIGYGWIGAPGLYSRDRGAPDDLRRDFVCSRQDATFNVDLSDGDYTVTLIIGDNSWTQDLMDVYAEDSLVIDDLTVPKGTFQEISFTVTVTDGQLNLRFHDDGGRSESWVCNVIKIVPPPQPYTVNLESIEDTSETSNLGTIIFDSAAYTLPNDITKPAGTYTVSFTADGYILDHWETSDGVSILGSTITVSGDGTLRAVYKVAPPGWYFDLGTPSSPIALGYTRVSELTSEPNYGWTDAAGLYSRDRGAPNDLRRDFVCSRQDATFWVNVPNGDYIVIVIIGDNSYTQDLIDVYAEDVLVINDLTVPIGTFQEITFTVTVTDGQLNLRFHDDGGRSASWVCNAITIETPSTLYNVHLESMEDTGATSSLGSIFFAGQSYTLPADVPKPEGTYEVSYTAPLGYVFDHWETSGDISIFGSTVTVTGDGTLTAFYRAVQGWYFDLGTPSSPVESGYVGVNETTLYDASLGYGWTNALGLYSRDRGAPDDLKRDFVCSRQDATFNVDLPNGDYTITLIIGDNDWTQDLMHVYAEGILVIDDLTVQKGTFQEISFTVTVTDGQLNLRFHDDGGSSLSWVCNAIKIEPAT